MPKILPKIRKTIPNNPDVREKRFYLFFLQVKTFGKAAGHEPESATGEAIAIKENARSFVPENYTIFNIVSL